MANTITFKINIDDNNTLSLVTKESKKAAAGVEKVDAATKKVNKSRKNYQKTEKGIGQAGLSSGKAMSKMSSGITSGLVPAYAVLAANVFAVTAAFGVLQRSTAVAQLNEGLVFTGRAAGQNLPLVVKGLKEITGAAISTAEAMRAVAIGTSAGFSQTQLQGLTKVARGASLALGRDMSDAMDRLVRGAAKLEPEILDELGIMVRLDDATEKYAASIGKTAGALSQFERRQAFTNAIIADGESKFAAISKAIDVNPYDKLAATFDNLSKTVMNAFSTVISPVISFLSDNVVMLAGTMTFLGTSVIRMMIPALTAGGTAMAEMAAETADNAKEQLASIKTFKGAPKVFAGLSEKVADGTATLADRKKLLTSLDRSERAHMMTMDASLKKHGKEGVVYEAKVETLKNVRGARTALKAAIDAETVSTRLNAEANVLNDASHVGIGATLTSLRGLWATELALVSANTAGQGFLARALAFTSAGFSLATFSVKAFAISLMTALPMLGVIVMAVTAAYQMFQKFFATPPTALEEALKEQKERLAEYPKIVDQLTTAFAHAKIGAEQFAAALKPSTGIIQQMLADMTGLISVQQNENVAKETEARIALIKAGQKKEKAQQVLHDANAIDMATNKNDSIFALIKKSYVQATLMRVGNDMARSGQDENLTTIVQAARTVPALLQRVGDAQEELTKVTTAAATAPIDVLKTTEGMTRALVHGIATMQQMSVVTAGNADTQKQLSEKIAESEKILAKLTKGLITPQQALKAFQELEARSTALQGSFDSAAASVERVTALFAGSGKATGIFSEHINDMKDTVDNFASGSDYKSILEKYGEVFKKYGINTGDPKKDADAFKKLLKDFSTANKETLMLGARQAIVSREIQTQVRLGHGLSAIRTNLVQLGNEETLARDTLLNTAITLGVVDEEALKILNDKKTIFNEEVLKKLEGLGIDKEILAILKLQGDQIDANADKRDKKNERATRLGGSTMGAGSSFGTLTADESAAFDAAGTADKLATLNAQSQASLKNLEKLGPEGAASAAVIQGALNITEAWMVGFENIAAAGDDTSAKLAAGMQMVGATINAISKMQQANAKADVAAIDNQIAAEQKRDGKSKGSLAKIAAMEKKKEQIKRKAFEQNKKMQMAEVVMATGVAIMNSIKMGLPWGAVFGAMAAAMGAAQLSAISSATYQGGSASAPTGPTAISMGERSNSVDLANSGSARGELAYMRGAEGTGGAGNFKPAFTGAKYRASGGETAGFMVGEQGPEMFIPDRSGRIAPADEVQAGGAPAQVTFNINTIDASGVEDMLTVQRGNIIGMIRTAANSYGQSFIEEIDTSTLQNNASAMGVGRY